MSDSEEKPRRSRKRVDENIEEVPAEWVEEADTPVEEEAPAPKKSSVKLKPSPIQRIEPPAAVEEEPPAEPKPVRKRTPKPKAAPAPQPPVERERPLRAKVPVLQKVPKLEVKAGKAASQARKEHVTRPLSFWGLMVRLLPMWALIVMILILAPSLPFAAVGAVVNWGLSQMPQRPTQSASEPVFIVEGSGEVAPRTELPPPNWPLEIAILFMPPIQYWEEDIAQWSLTYRIKPNMIATIMQIESCGDPSAQSPMGATGLLQVMPLHFEAGEDATEPTTNAKRGLLYLGQMLAEANGDTGRAFAAYNGGPSMLYTSPADWPTETQSYQFWASGIYEDAELGLDVSPTLDAWLEAGGESLCAQASAVLGLR